MAAPMGRAPLPPRPFATAEPHHNAECVGRASTRGLTSPRSPKSSLRAPVPRSPPRHYTPRVARRHPAQRRRTAQRELAGGSIQASPNSPFAHIVHRAQSLKGISIVAWGCQSAAAATPGDRLQHTAGGRRCTGSKVRRRFASSCLITRECRHVQTWRSAPRCAVGPRVRGTDFQSVTAERLSPRTAQLGRAPLPPRSFAEEDPHYNAKCVGAQSVSAALPPWPHAAPLAGLCRVGVPVRCTRRPQRTASPNHLPNGAASPAPHDASNEWFRSRHRFYRRRSMASR